MLYRFCHLDQQICFALFLFCFLFSYESYDLICPVVSQWQTRVNGYCDAGKHYMCLYDENNASHIETCEESPDFQPAGFITIRVGGLDRKECKKTRYQPFKYWTNQSSECVIEKSLCNELGQVVHNNGSTRTDRTCRCDYTRGYTYVMPPKHKCYCEPAEEDCICILKSCPVQHFLNPDYICVQTTDLIGDFKCSEIKYSSHHPQTIETIYGQEKQVPITGKKEYDHILMLSSSIVLLVFIGSQVMNWWLSDPYQSIVQLEDDEDYVNSLKDPKLIRIYKWENRNKDFVMSESVETIMNHLEKMNTVLVTGPTGIGKSTILQHIAIFYRNLHKFEICICDTPQELMQFCTGERKQVIVIDDIGGKYAAVQSEMDEWYEMQLLITKLPIQDNIKIIASCNEQVFQDIMFKRSKLFSKDSSFQHSLSLKEKLKIANRYLPENIINKVNLSNNQYPALPLLCFLAKDMSSEHDTVDMLTSPVDHYMRELEKFWKTDKLKSFSLFLLVLKFGLIDRSSFFNLDSELMDMITKTHRTFNVDNNNQLNGSILATFKSLTGKYLQQNGQVFTLIHEAIYDIVCHYFGNKVQQDIIENANSKVIRDRTLFKSLTNGKDSNFRIMIKEDNEKKYFDRVMRSRNIEDILCNSQMCYSGYRQKLIKYLENTLDQNCLEMIFNSNNGNMLPIHIVCMKGYADMLMFIMKFKSCINKDAFPYVFEACKQGNKETVTLLIKNGADINKGCNKTGITPIMMACQDKNYECINLLIANDVDIYKEAHNGLNALVAAFTDGDMSLIDLFVEMKVDLNETRGSGWTPLMKACGNGHTDVVKYLLKKDVNVNLADCNKETALMKACAGNHVEIINQLLLKGADVNQNDNNGWTPLLKACQLGTTGIVETLIKQNSDVNHADNEGNTCLIKACKYGHTDIVNLLLNHGGQVNVKSKKGGFSPFLVACEAGHEDILKMLAPRVTDVDERDHSGCTPLIRACRKGYLNIVQTLIELRVDIRKADENKRSPLMNACDCKTGNYEIVRLLIEHHADVNRQDTEGWTPLSKACRQGNEKIAELLLTNKADVNLASYTGWTPFMSACETDKLNLVFLQLLVDKGAKIHLSNNLGWNALLSACKRGHYDLVKFLLNEKVDVNIANCSGVNPVMVACENGHLKILEILYKNRANLNSVDINEKNAVMFAYQGCNKDIVNSLVLRGVEINQQDSDGWTILMKAAKDGDTPTINLLLENNAHSDRYDTDGQCCVTKASKGGHKSTVELLLEKGAQCDTIDKKGWTPLMWAAEGGHIDVAQVLINNGANVKHVANEPRHWTALMSARNRGYTNIVKVLIENGALSSEYIDKTNGM